MIGRFVVAVLLCAQILPALAAKPKAADDDVEYLLPPDGEPVDTQAKAPAGLPLTPKAFRAGIAKYIKEVPQYSAAKLDAGNVLKDGAIVHQALKLNGSEVDILLDVNAAGKISNAKFNGPKGAKDDAQLRLMMCSTYAIMRTLQPDLESPAAAQANMKHSWESAANQPFEKSFYFNKIKTQYVPFEMNVY